MRVIGLELIFIFWANPIVFNIKNQHNLELREIICYSVWGSLYFTIAFHSFSGFIIKLGEVIIIFVALGIHLWLISSAFIIC